MGPSKEMRRFGGRSKTAEMLNTGGKLVVLGCIRLEASSARKLADHERIQHVDQTLRTRNFKSPE